MGEIGRGRSGEEKQRKEEEKTGGTRFTAEGSAKWEKSTDRRSSQPRLWVANAVAVGAGVWKSGEGKQGSSAGESRGGADVTEREKVDVSAGGECSDRVVDVELCAIEEAKESLEKCNSPRPLGHF